MTSLAFERQKAKGDVAEKRVLDVFQEDGWAVQRRFKGAKSDLVVTLPTGTEILEVKNEDRYAESASVCVELHQGKPPRPSGLKTSEATVCIHTLGGKCLVYRRCDMLNHIERGLNCGLYTQGPFNGADNHNGGVLVDRFVVSRKDWAELVDLAALPKSRVFSVARE